MGKVNVRAKAKKAINRLKVQSGQILKSTSRANESHDTKDKLLLHKTLPTTTITSKKEKARQKHKNLLNKFTVLKKQRKEEIARKNREKAGVVGDLRPLKDALPSLDELYVLTKEKKDIRTGIATMDDAVDGEGGTSMRQKLKRKKKQFINKMNSYEALLNDADFKKNPRDVIAYHIKYKHGLVDGADD